MKSLTEQHKPKAEQTPPAIKNQQVDNVPIGIEEFLSNNPQFRSGLTERFFELLSAEEFTRATEVMTSPTPLNDGRFELFSDDGQLISREYRSPEDEYLLGFNDVNKYKGAGLSDSELRALDGKLDAAASVELARRAYAGSDAVTGDDFMMRAAKLSGLPAPLTLAGRIHSSPPFERQDLIIAGAFYIAAFVSGDHTVASKLRFTFGRLTPDLQDISIDLASDILSAVNG